MFNNGLSIFLFALFFLTTTVCKVDGAAFQSAGIVQGLVKDPNGALIKGAKVTLSYFSTNYKAVTITDEEGYFRFVNVPFNP